MFARDYARYYDLFNQDKPYEKEVGFVYEWAERPRSIFDIGAGTGSYWKFFPPETRVIGIDKSPSMPATDKLVFIGDVTEYKTEARFDCATALFDVINYIPRHDWWANIPVQTGGFFIFDIWDTEKIKRDGFKQTFKSVSGASRRITPIRLDEKSVDLRIQVMDGEVRFQEDHTMYLYSHEDILRFCVEDFEVIDVMPTPKWQKWYKCIKK